MNKDNPQLPTNSDCYASWEFADQDLTLTYAKLCLKFPGRPIIEFDTDDLHLLLMDSPKRLRLKIDKGQIMTKGIARVEVTAIDDKGNNSKRRIVPDMIRFW